MTIPEGQNWLRVKIPHHKVLLDGIHQLFLEKGPAIFGNLTIGLIAC